MDSSRIRIDAWWIHHSMPCRYVGSNTNHTHIPPPTPYKPRLTLTNLASSPLISAASAMQQQRLAAPAAVAVGSYSVGVSPSSRRLKSGRSNLLNHKPLLSFLRAIDKWGLTMHGCVEAENILLRPPLSSLALVEPSHRVMFPCAEQSPGPSA